MPRPPALNAPNLFQLLLGVVLAVTHNPGVVEAKGSGLNGGTAAGAYTRPFLSSPEPLLTLKTSLKSHKHRSTLAINTR